MSPFPRRTLLTGLAASAALVVVGCSSDNKTQAQNEPPKVDKNRHDVFVKAPTDNIAVTDDAAGAHGVSQALLSGATAVVVYTEAAASAQPTPGAGAETPAPTAAPAPGAADPRIAADVARALGVPMLENGADLTAELDRLQTRTVIAYPPEGLDVGDREVIPGPASADQLPDLPGLPRKPEENEQLVLAQSDNLRPSIAATLAAAGVRPTVIASGEPGENSETVAQMKSTTEPALAVGAAFGSSSAFAEKLRIARTAAELPGGGTAPFPGRRMIALYGHPETPSLGMMGEQTAPEAVRRVKDYVAQYQQQWPDQKVIGAFEIITTVASSDAGGDGDYSYETPMETILPWIEEAEKNEMYAVLDLQPGRTDFFTQVKRYEELLKRPWVGLALDPEWRLKPDGKHLTEIGQVSVDEINQVGTWLADLVKANNLPTKVLTLHQFQLRMILDRENLDVSRPEIQYLMHADGSGGQGQKQDTWRVLKQDLQPQVYLGWKNFEDEDSPMLTPAQTVQNVEPDPYFISYQ